MMACYSRSEQTTRKYISHNADHSSCILVGGFWLTWGTLYLDDGQSPEEEFNTTSVCCCKFPSLTGSKELLLTKEKSQPSLLPVLSNGMIVQNSLQGVGKEAVVTYFHVSF
jgi:hypothetical protein